MLLCIKSERIGDSAIDLSVSNLSGEIVAKLSIRKNATVAELRLEIEKKSGIAQFTQTLTYMERPLAPNSERGDKTKLADAIKAAVAAAGGVKDGES